jgi:hypothetical protein
MSFYGSSQPLTSLLPMSQEAGSSDTRRTLKRFDMQLTNDYYNYCRNFANIVNCAIHSIKPKLCSNIVNHCNVMIVTVKGHPGPLHLMNTYSDENGSAI